MSPSARAAPGLADVSAAGGAAPASPALAQPALGSPPWWRATTVYHVYPRSFADANGDGIGDLRGLTSRLDYLHDLGVETIRISPFFESPQVDLGYDISDHYRIDPASGTDAEFHHLVDEIHRRGMKVVLDMVLNHTSDRHRWFLDSRSSRAARKRDWYIWRDGRDPETAAPPNNWKSMLGGSGWHHDPVTDQWYWASFLPCQPDLNYRNPEVRRAMLDVVRHWLARGVDGLRLDIFGSIFKDAAFADNPFALRLAPSDDNPDGYFQRALHTHNHPDTLAFARELRAVVDRFQDPPRFLVGEVFGRTESLRRYCRGDEGDDGLHLVFLFKTLRTPFRADAFHALVGEFEAAFPDPLLPTYVFSNHDRSRSFVRLGEDEARSRLLATFQLTVRGVPFIYYGEEIGMRHVEVPTASARDGLAQRFRRVPRFVARHLERKGILLNRDACRTPMQWHDGPNGGFAPAEATPWLPLHPAHGTVNVAAQRADATSLLACYRRMLGLRRGSAALHDGHLELLPQRSLGREVLAFRRVARRPGSGAGSERAETATVYLNFSDRPTRPLDLRVHAGCRLVSNLRDGEAAPPPDRALAPYEGIVLVEGGNPPG